MRVVHSQEQWIEKEIVGGKKTSQPQTSNWWWMVSENLRGYPSQVIYEAGHRRWGIENKGVEPDFDVEIMPADLLAGRDSQLVKAIETAMKQIAQTPVKPSKRPAFPIHPGKQ